MRRKLISVVLALVFAFGLVSFLTPVEWRLCWLCKWAGCDCRSGVDDVNSV
jgi:hypothetical protein